MRSILECWWRHSSGGTSTYTLKKLIHTGGVCFVVLNQEDRELLKAYLLVEGCNHPVVDSHDLVPFNKMPMAPIH